MKDINELLGNNPYMGYSGILDKCVEISSEIEADIAYGSYRGQEKKNKTEYDFGDQNLLIDTVAIEFFIDVRANYNLSDTEKAKVVINENTANISDLAFYPDWGYKYYNNGKQRRVSKKIITKNGLKTLRIHVWDIWISNPYQSINYDIELSVNSNNTVSKHMFGGTIDIMRKVKDNYARINNYQPDIWKVENIGFNKIKIYWQAKNNYKAEKLEVYLREKDSKKVIINWKTVTFSNPLIFEDDAIKNTVEGRMYELLIRGKSLNTNGTYDYGYDSYPFELGFNRYLRPRIKKVHFPNLLGNKTNENYIVVIPSTENTTAFIDYMRVTNSDDYRIYFNLEEYEKDELYKKHSLNNINSMSNPILQLEYTDINNNYKKYWFNKCKVAVTTDGSIQSIYIKKDGKVRKCQAYVEVNGKIKKAIAYTKIKGNIVKGF